MTVTDVRLDERRTGNRPDFLLIGAMAALTALGLLMIYSVTAPRLASAGLDRSGDMTKQAFFAGLGFIVFAIASLIPPRVWKSLTPLAYGASILLLFAVLSPVGAVRGGAQRWIPLGVLDLQPSELAKPAVVLALALLLVPVEEGRMRWMRIAKSLVLVGAPGALVFLQPDLGTALVFGFVTVVMLFTAGATVRQIILLAVGAVIAVVVAFSLDILQEYQLARLTGFLNAGEQTLTLNYNQVQSQVAIGNGGLFGTGLFEGTQTNLAFVPAQRTDFIFTAVGEQLGFVGSALVLGLFALVIWRCLQTAGTAQDRYSQLVPAGIGAMLMFHVFVNVGMNVGLLPVTGLPLPFMSYGGSFFLSMGLSLGIVHSIWLRKTVVPADVRLMT
jgi:rod shape determining protein RodA